MKQTFHVHYNGDTNREAFSAIVTVGDDYTTHGFFSFDIINKWKELIAETYTVSYENVLTEEEYQAQQYDGVEEYLDSLYED